MNISKAISSSPIPSLLLGAAGGALVGARSRRRGPGLAAAIAGLAIIGVAAHRPVADALRTAGTRRRSAHLRLSFVVQRPVPDVFRFFGDFENYPRFIGALRSVQDFGDGRSHWTSWTPTGGTLAWDALTTKFVTNRVISWRSTSRSPVRMCGTLRFLPEPGGGTCVKVVFDYSVVDGGMADAVAALAIPRRAGDLEADIRRLSDSFDLLIDAAKPSTASARIG